MCASVCVCERVCASVCVCVCARAHRSAYISIYVHVPASVLVPPFLFGFETGSLTDYQAKLYDH